MHNKTQHTHTREPVFMCLSYYLHSFVLQYMYYGWNIVMMKSYV